MSGQSLGLIETVGLAPAIEAADAAVKSANVELCGYELTKGGGMITIKLLGDVGAINAAVAAGVAAASRVGKVNAYKVIARTAEGIETLIRQTDNQSPVQPDEVPEVRSEVSSPDQVDSQTTEQELEDPVAAELPESEEAPLTSSDSPELPTVDNNSENQPAPKPRGSSRRSPRNNS